MTALIWDHQTPINGISPAELHQMWGITASTIVVIAGQSPPHDTDLFQSSNPATGAPWTSASAALAWAEGQALPGSEPPPPPPQPAPTVESLSAKIHALEALQVTQDAMISQLLIMLLDPNPTP